MKIIKSMKYTVLCISGIAVIALLIFFLISVVEKNRKSHLIQERGEVTIVVFGDSIWDICRDATGIAAVLERELKEARVVNCAMMGTLASYKHTNGEMTEEECQIWNEKSLVGLVENEDRLQVIARETGVNDVPLEEADYIIIAYGLNDYFTGIPRMTEDPRDPYSFCGALRIAVGYFRENYPEAQILLLSQTYCQGYSYGKVDSESDYKDYGGGTGPDYVASEEALAEELGCIFINNYKDMGINIHNGAKYLVDATHLTETGRKKYARNLAKYLLEMYAEELKNID